MKTLLRSILSFFTIPRRLALVPVKAQYSARPYFARTGMKSR